MSTMKKMIEQDIATKETVRDIIVKLARAQIFIVIIGVFLLISIVLNYYFTYGAINHIKINRQEMFNHKKQSDSILNEIRKINNHE